MPDIQAVQDHDSALQVFDHMVSRECGFKGDVNHHKDKEKDRDFKKISRDEQNLVSWRVPNDENLVAKCEEHKGQDEWVEVGPRGKPRALLVPDDADEELQEQGDAASSEKDRILQEAAHAEVLHASAAALEVEREALDSESSFDSASTDPYLQMKHDREVPPERNSGGRVAPDSPPESSRGAGDRRSAAEAASGPPRSLRSGLFRQRLWTYLFRNMRRAIDEVYFMCEVEGDVEQVHLTVSILEHIVAS
ncbi:hypothetical protein CYMTET_34256 [Cymbomonas tetramitiformis]|uniref:S phase cyclin A-associated protein in the endoplasmic reticulum N-terminal domain-containing protein n=1 Tax=Cymbomonas tetramitiformis TaxID=36881 RepID=A0AAE0FBJ9_9CHLO|nr:hypothetical protein CYMTET_34256 [Cymbomonas tetramitiformis]